MDLLLVDPVPPNYLQLLPTAGTKALEDGHSVDVLYFDFAKAFDSVPHNRLIAKLQGLGVSGRLLTWLKIFLVNRKQKVVLNTCSSSWSSVKSGVPQGSVLGPVLYVSDMPHNVDSILLQFADDVKMFRAIKTTQDFHCLQSDIDKLVAWCKLWQLNFNVNNYTLVHHIPSVNIPLMDLLWSLMILLETWEY